MDNMVFSVIRASRTLMVEVQRIINSNFYLYKDIIVHPEDISEHQVDEAWVEKNFARREFYVARDQGEYVGMCSYQKIGSFAYIGYLFVQDGYHRQGYGKKMLQFLEMRTYQDKLTDLRLFSNKNAKWAIEAYLKMGFSILSSDATEICNMEGGVMAPFYEANHIFFQKILPSPKPISFM
ncbi:hypothetical protein WKT22_02451 [Candidatus Lokiarchaeum ossiferum]